MFEKLKNRFGPQSSLLKQVQKFHDHIVPVDPSKPSHQAIQRAFAKISEEFGHEAALFVIAPQGHVSYRAFAKHELNVICVSEQLAGLVQPAELEAIIAHEFAHLTNPQVERKRSNAFDGLLEEMRAQRLETLLQPSARQDGQRAAEAKHRLQQAGEALRAAATESEIAADETVIHAGRAEALMTGLMKIALVLNGNKASQVEHFLRLMPQEEVVKLCVQEEDRRPLSVHQPEFAVRSNDSSEGFAERIERLRAAAKENPAAPSRG